MSRSDLRNWPILSLLEPEFIAELKMVMVYGNVNPCTFDNSRSVITLLGSTGNLGNEALLLLKDGSVHAVGNNASGCLGTGDTHSTLEPVKIESLSQKGIKAFSYGIGPHVLALTEKGEVSNMKCNFFNYLIHPLIWIYHQMLTFFFLSTKGHFCLAVKFITEALSVCVEFTWKYCYDSASQSSGVQKKKKM